MDKTSFQKITSLQFEGEFIIINSNNQIFKWKISAISEKLANASDSQKNNFKISPSGYGIHWPDLEEDLSLKGLPGQE